MIYGGDYNPEQWPESVWTEDVRLMREAGVTMVNLGVFAWSRIEPEEGVFDWAWLDRVIDLLHANGITVDLATATASPPPWAIERYPTILPKDENGSTYWQGSRQHYAPTSPDYRRLAGVLVAAIAARYAEHPAVVMWHVNNEIGCHLHYDYSDHARDAFQSWLERKYATIDVLNEAWGNAFWSHWYTSFRQIVPPRKAPYAVNPAGALDFKRFTSDALLDLFVMERDIIRASGATQPVTTNFMGAFAPADYWKWAREIDVIADDNYPDPNDPESFRAAAFTRDLMRSLKPGVPWLLMEQSTGPLNWRTSNAPKAPGQMAALSAQAIGHGADGIMFFQWRQSRRGSEKFHSAMLPHAGTDTRIWKEVVGLGETIAAMPTMPPDSHAEVAIVFDWENWWAISHGYHPVALDYLGLIQRWYAALHSAQVSIDIVHPAGDLSGYRLAVVPQLYLLTDAGAANIAGFVERGGHILVSAFTDVVDADDAFRDGGYLVALRDVLGVSLEDHGALVPPTRHPTGWSVGDEVIAVAGGGPGESAATVLGPFGKMVGQYFAEEIHLHGAEPIGTFVDGRLSGRVAMTSNRHGAGTAVYVATIPDDAGMRELVTWSLHRAHVQPEVPGLPREVEVARRGDILTLINHGGQPVRVSVAAGDVLSGESLTGFTLERFGWRMIRLARPSGG